MNIDVTATVIYMYMYLSLKGGLRWILGCLAKQTLFQDIYAD